MANPGSIVVSAYTRRLTDGYFAFKDLGPTQIKGVEDPLNIYEVLGAGPLRTRLQITATRRGLTRFVGRYSEMEQLTKALEQTKAGHGQIVGTLGEAGLGKSRLFYEVKLLSVGGCLVLEAYSVSHGKATAYLPVIELLKSYFQLHPQDDDRQRRAKVLGQVLVLDRSLEDTLAYLFALLGIEEQPSPLQQMDAQIRRRRTFEALKKLFLGESLNQPLILAHHYRRSANSQMRQGLEAYAGELRRTVYLARLAEGYRGAGQVEEGLAAIAEALRLVDKNDDRYYEAEVWRIKGQLVLESGVRTPDSENPSPQAEAEAEACFQQAIGIAQQQSAKSWELRAATSMARLWQQQGKRARAHALLTPVYEWFTEGFDTADLKDAKALLEELSI